MLTVSTRKAALKLAPGAAKIVKVCGGYMAFATITEWQTWRNQR
jgi:hypothetical protein